MALRNDMQFTWLGHATFKITSPKGKQVLIDPWVMHNPSCPAELQKFDRLDLMLVTHGHFDHIADAVELGKKHKPRTICNYETSVWLESKGVENLVGMNKGGTVELDGIRVTMVSADHSCGILDDGKIIYGGDPAGFVVEFENGFKIYHAGDTNVFGDMKLIGELYRPDVALLPIGSHYTMGPREAAHAIRLLGVKRVIPMHYGTFPILRGSPGQLRELTADIPGLEIHELKPGQSV